MNFVKLKWKVKKMKKISIMVLSMFSFVLLLTGCGCSQQEKKPEELTDAKKFAQEYNQVSEDNVFVYRDVDQIIKIMKNGTGVVYLGYPECPWCQVYVKYLNEVAKDVGMDQIYYCNTKKVKESNMEKYQELITLLDGHLQYNNEGEQWIYVPNVSFHVKGKILGNDYESSKDTLGFKDPNKYWTEERIKALKERLTPWMEEVRLQSSICTDCNK